jgi:hypothetical protein
VDIGVNDFEDDFGNLAQCPCNGILNSHTAVGTEHRDKCTESLVDKWAKDSGVGSFEHGSECHDGSLSLLPAGASDVAFDELNDSRYDWVSDVLGE